MNTQDPAAPATIPSDYRDGHLAAQRIDRALADRYLLHTTRGDPLADAVVEALAGTGAQGEGWIRRGIEEGPAAVADAPRAVQDFFAAAEVVPGWWRPDAVRAGCRAFHRNSEMFIGAFVAAVLIEGFSTLISRSFGITGRLVDQGVRRLKQNNRHLVEIFMPGGLERYGDGWKLSVRIRLVHAQVRYLLRHSAEWDAAAWGTPLSAAHIGYATASFSGLLLKRAAMLGVRLSAEERESFMMVWRYSGHLMGVPPELSCASEAEALALNRIGTVCEPPPGDDSILLANGLIQSAPVVAGIVEPKERRRMAAYIGRISRALIGDARADQLGYPPGRTFGVLALFRWRNRIDHGLQRLLPWLARRRRASQFQQMIALSMYDEGGIRYRMPEHVHAEKDLPI